MTGRARASILALLGAGLACLGVSPGSAQDSAGNQTGEVAASPIAPVPNAAPQGLAAGPPPEAAPTVAPPVSADTDADANQAANTASSDDAASAPVAPQLRPRYTTAVLQALDKVTAETLRFEAKVDEPVRYKDLVITVHDCETSAPNEAPKDAIVAMDVQYQPAVLSGGASAVRQVFRGWMFAQSPGLQPFATPIYDVWVVACKTPAPAAPAPAAPAPSPPPNGASL
jgi:hypothetical protein